MKALVKGSEALFETEWSPFVKAHLDWMQASEGYVLVQDYVEPVSGEEFIGEIAVETPAEPVKEESTEETVTVNGVTMTKSEALELLSKTQ